MNGVGGVFFFVRQETAYEMLGVRMGSEMGIVDRVDAAGGRGSQTLFPGPDTGLIVRLR